MIPVYEISVPEYTVNKEPDWSNIGKKIDEKIKKHFLGKKVVIRCLGSQDHRGKSIDDVIRIIKELGTDRYDPNILGDRYENIENKKIDFFGLDFEIKPDSSLIENFIKPFYSWPLSIGEPPIRIDILIIYDYAEVKIALHKYKNRSDVKRDGFIFKHPDKKNEAIFGIIKIL